MSPQKGGEVAEGGSDSGRMTVKSASVGLLRKSGEEKCLLCGKRTAGGGGWGGAVAAFL